MSAALAASGQRSMNIAGSAGPRETRGPGRPRNSDIEQQVIAAAVELVDAGEEVTVARLVERSGVSRAAIYRRWPSITQLVAVALDVGRGSYPEILPEDDLHAAIVDGFLLGGEPAEKDYPKNRFRQRIKLGIDDPALQRTYWESHVARRRAPLERTLSEAVQQGKLRADLDVAACIDALGGVVYYQVVVRGADLHSTETRERVSAALEIIWRGMQPDSGE